MRYKKDNLITIITIVMAVNLVALVWFGWDSYSTYRDFQVTGECRTKTEKLQGLIVHLDEVLTMSARMAIATGDLKWEKRYREFEPKLDVAIKEAMMLWSETYRGEAIAMVDTANSKLVEMENQAFDLVRQGYTDEARAIILSNEYDDQKRIFSQGIAIFSRHLHFHDQLVATRAIIIHLDEVLTMSARMAAVTGDLKWEERYREFEPKLNAAINEAIAVSPQAYNDKAVLKTAIANLKLVEMENQAFDLIRKGNSDSAVSILFGNPYVRQKSVYSDGMTNFDSVITKLASSCTEMERVAHSTSVKTKIVLSLSLLLVFTWLIVFRTIHRWRKTLVRNNRQLAQQADDLTMLNKNLDQKVFERTQELEVSRQTAVKARQTAEDANKFLKAEISERKKAEEKLLRYECIVSSSNDMMALLDKNFVYLAANNKYLESFSLTQSKLIGSTISDVFGDTIFETIIRPHAERCLQGNRVSYNETFDFPVLGERYMEITYNPFLSSENKILGFSVNKRDITERKQVEDACKLLEKSLFQSDKMASIGQLAAGVAHEINNPIGFISSNLNTMNKYLWKLAKIFTGEDKNSSENQQIVTEIIEDFGDAISESLEGTSRVCKIVADLKGFSRADTGEVEYANLNKGLETTLNIVWNQLKYSCKIEKDLGDIPDIECFPNKINQVFMNLLVNAGQAVEGNSGLIRIKTWADDDHVHVSIRDNGCGIPEENLPKLFDAFFTTKEVGKGTGLGLNLVYDIVKSHDGTIAVDSEVGKGTEFVLTLPVGKTEKHCEDSVCRR